MSARLLSLATGYGGLDMAVEATTGARLAYVSDVGNGVVPAQAEAAFAWLSRVAEVAA